MKMTVKEIAQLVGGVVTGDDEREVVSFKGIESAEHGDLSFIYNEKYASFIENSKASAIIIPESLKVENGTLAALIRVSDPKASMQILSQTLTSNHPLSDNNGESYIADESQIGENTIIYPQVYIADNVVIGHNCIIYPGVRIMKDTVIGDRVIIHANAVIGADGFGFVKNEQNIYEKIPQIGNVVIEDDVEIGSNCVIDRASIGSTWICKGVKLDNLIQIAHNVKIGENTVIAAQTGIAGSTTIGKNCMIGGQVGIVGHITIADGTMIQAQSGVASSILIPNTKVYGSPAIAYHSFLRSFAVFKKMPELIKDLRNLKKEDSKPPNWN